MKKNKKIKKPYIVAILAGLAGLGFCQERPETMIIKEWLGTLGTTTATQYIGEAQTTENTTTAPAQADAVWRITKKTYDAAGLPLTESIARSPSGNNHTVSWTNRTTTTYNAKP